MNDQEATASPITDDENQENGTNGSAETIAPTTNLDRLEEALPKDQLSQELLSGWRNAEPDTIEEVFETILNHRNDEAKGANTD